MRKAKEYNKKNIIREFVRALLVPLFMAAGLQAAAAQTPAGTGKTTGVAVVATIKPLHALVAGVMAGTGQPQLLLTGTASPHSFTLRPSQALALQKAAMVFWIGPLLESALEAPLKSLAGDATVVALTNLKGIVRHPYRAGGVWGEDDHGDHNHNHKADKGHNHGHNHGDAGTDQHIWLDPRNAVVFVRHIAATLQKADPANAATYAANAARLIEQLQALRGELDAMLKPVRNKPYMVFHDSFQYFEKVFSLTGAGAITLGDGRSPGVRRLRAIRRAIAKGKVVCVFAEPQFEPRLVRTVIERTKAKAATLDPLGAKLTPGPDLYFQLMRANAKAMKDCLSAS